MHVPIRTASLSAALVLGLTLAACDGGALAPADGTLCTVGTLAPQDSVSGVVNASSCEVFDPDSYNRTFAQSWTLRVQANTAYIVRLRQGAGLDPLGHFNGNVEAFGRNAQGDPSLLTGWWGTFGDPNANGGQDMEMFLTPDQARTLSIRVSSYSKADSGAYSLVVEQCRVTTFDASAAAHDNIDLGRGCRAESVDYFTGSPMKVSFFSFPSAANVNDSVLVDRTAGTGSFFSYVAGPGLDLACWGGDCTSAGGNSFGTTAKYRISPDLPGRMTILAGVRADSAATVSIRVVTTPPAQPGATVPTAPLTQGGR